MARMPTSGGHFRFLNLNLNLNLNLQANEEEIKIRIKIKIMRGTQKNVKRIARHGG